MSLMNIMEEKIKTVVNDILLTRADRFILVKYMDDIIAFVLNRVPSRYVTSGRGLLHSEIDFSVNSQLHTDIRFCVNDAIRTLLQRREPEEKLTIIEDIERKHYYYPYVIGEVLEELTFSIIPDVEIQLTYKDFIIPMIDSSWPNPYYTNAGTKGYYIFWPDFIKEEMDVDRENIFKVVFRHKNYHKKELSFILRTLDNSNLNRSLVVPLALLKLKDDNI